MATKQEENSNMPQGPISESIKIAETLDAENIVTAFNNEYVKYYGKYVDENKLESFIQDELPEDLESDNVPDEMIWTVENNENEDFIGAGAIKFDDNLAELGSTIISPEYRGKRTEDGTGLYDELFLHRLNEAEKLVRSGEIDIVNTQLLADKSAATQNTAHKHGFAVTGIYDKKFPVAYEGKGRVTVVDMLWADSNIENSQEEVYVPETASELVEEALENINQKRSDEYEEITREVLGSDAGNHESQSYSVNTKVVDGPEEDPMNFAEVSIVEDELGDYAWSDVVKEISSAQTQISNEEDDYWVGISLDANHSSGTSAARFLEEFGFEYAGFNPGKLETSGENRDALEMEYRPSDEKIAKQYINEAVQFMDAADTSYEEFDEDKTNHNNSQLIRA